MSIQVAILKVLASHGNGRATLASLKRDIAILSASGPEWNARIKRLAGRIPIIDIFGNGHVLRDDDGWQITLREQVPYFIPPPWVADPIPRRGGRLRVRGTV